MGEEDYLRRINWYCVITGVLVVQGCSNMNIITDGVSFFFLKCPEMVAPHGSYEPIFGTNPLAIGIPTGPDDPSLILDMATSAEAWFGLVSSKTCNIAWIIICLLMKV
jgi:LDH2 family malate/lactate/ureidoglycolate dehydrogenase